MLMKYLLSIPKIYFVREKNPTEIRIHDLGFGGLRGYPLNHRGDQGLGLMKQITQTQH